MAKPVVCVVGAGTAGLEALLAAREELGPSIELRLIAPEREFRYRPKSDSLFRPAGEGSLAIGDLVDEVGATWVKSSAETVYQAERTVLTRDGDTVDFDYLLLAPGTRAKRALRQGYLWVRGGDPSFLDRIIQGLLAGEARSVAVAVPRGARWPLPAYELALVLSWSTAGTDARITLITTEERPLGALGAAAAELIERELDAARVEAIAGVEVADGRSGDGADSVCVRLGPGSVAEFDRVIALPIAVGPFIGGVATDASGFIDVDETLRVCGSERVWAAGGCIAAALEHSALGARQADTAIVAIAAAISGATAPVAPDLVGMLLTGQCDRWRAENPVGTREPSTRCLWWPPGRAVGRMLAQRIAAWDPSVTEAVPGRPDGVIIHAPVALGCSDTTSSASGAEVSEDVRAARMRDIQQRQLMAIRRRERDADAELQALSARLETLAARQHEVVKELRQHGYLHDHP